MNKFIQNKKMTNNTTPPNRSSSRRSVNRAAGEVNISSPTRLYLNTDNFNNSDNVIYANSGVVENNNSNTSSTIKSLLLTSWSKIDVLFETQTLVTYINDDSDHYYETLSPNLLDEQVHASNVVPQQHSKKTKDIGELSEDYDSFTDEEVDVTKNDSGVDMNIKQPELPGPPPNSINLYATFQRLKNFVTNKKAAKNQKPNYDNTQFYVESANSTLTAGSVENVSKTSYENFNISVGSEESNSKTLQKVKSKGSNRIKSKLRKSLVLFDSNSNLSEPRSTFYTEKNSSGSVQNLSCNNDSELSIPKKFATLVKKSKKSSLTSTNSERRKASPTLLTNEPVSENKTKSSTSWYTESGVFKDLQDAVTIATPTTAAPVVNHSEDKSNHTSWYAEIGLYQTSGNSNSSSSGISSGEGGAYENSSISHDNVFFNEPLYQIYNAAKVESITRDMEDDRSSTFDGYEEIGSPLDDHENHDIPPVAPKRKTRPSALQLVSPKQGPSRTLWSEISEVKASQILYTLTPNERRIQEAKFEIITSEASYLKSLNLLRTHFMNHPALRDSSVLSPKDRKKLFGQIIPVQECSDMFLKNLENCWQENIMLLDLGKIIYDSADKYFHVYIKFCEHQAEMDRTLRRLKETKGGLFSKTLDVLESDVNCCGLSLHSFLMLPMQRITRLPLLLDSVFSKIKYDNDEHESWKMCLSILNKFAKQCNEAANRCEQAYEMQRISSKIEFPSNITPLSINSTGILSPGAKPRYLVRHGELVHLIWRGEDAKRTFGKKVSKCNIYAFLFSDLLVLTKKKADEHFLVFDYCPRSLLTVASGDEMLPNLAIGKDNNLVGKNLILMTLLENYEKKTVELVLSCKTVSEQQRWLQATNPIKEGEVPGEKLYEEWDCPQVMAKHEFSANEPDTLNLEPGDIVNVLRKLPDGWYHGERIRDGACGWFPGNFTEEINLLHVRSRNLKQRHRLLTFTAAYLDSQKKTTKS